MQFPKHNNQTIASEKHALLIPVCRHGPSQVLYLEDNNKFQKIKIGFLGGTSFWLLIRWYRNLKFPSITIHCPLSNCNKVFKYFVIPELKIANPPYFGMSCVFKLEITRS